MEENAGRIPTIVGLKVREMFIFIVVFDGIAPTVTQAGVGMATHRSDKTFDEG